MSLVMIVLALLPVRPAALNDPMVYPAALLVLLLVSCAVNWRTFLDGFKGLGKTPVAGQPFDFHRRWVLRCSAWPFWPPVVTPTAR